MLRAEMRADGVRGEFPQPLVNALKEKKKEKKKMDVTAVSQAVKSVLN